MTRSLQTSSVLCCKLLYRNLETRLRSCRAALLQFFLTTALSLASISWRIVCVKYFRNQSHSVADLLSKYWWMSKSSISRVLPTRWTTMLTGVLLKGSFNNFLMFSPSEMTSTSGITSTKSLASLKEEKPVCKGLEEENPLVFRPSLSQFFGGFLNKNLDM